MSRQRPQHRPQQPQPTGLALMWENGSALYRRMVLTGSGLFFVGIVLSIIGAFVDSTGISFIALGVLAAGVVVHLLAQTIRFRDADRNRRRAQGSRR